MKAIPKAIFDHIRRMEIETAKLAEEMMVGLYHSVFKGQGMEFEEVRDYVAGDDPRNIDWNVTARSGSPHVKTFKEERELTVFLLIDISASVRFGGSGNRLKSDYIAEIAALLAFTAIKNSDKVGMILFSDRIEKYLPPKKGLRHVLRLIRDLLVIEPQGVGSDIGVALELLGKVQSKSAVTFLFSDFFCSLPPHQLALAARRHDLIALHINDPSEVALPNLGLISVVDPESGSTSLVDSSSPAVRQQYEQQVLERKKRSLATIKRAGASVVAITTDSPYITPLRQFFQRRRIRH